MDDTEDNRKRVMFFGRDISRIPCFRNSFLYGIEGGIAVGLIAFMFTSRPRLATHVAVGSFTVITLGYWVQCRYKYSQTKFQYAQLKAALQRHVMYEGTPMESELKGSDKED